MVAGDELTVAGSSAGPGHNRTVVSLCSSVSQMTLDRTTQVASTPAASRLGLTEAQW